MSKQEYEYDEHDSGTWVQQPPPAFPQWFQEELTRLAGTNRHGRPNLRLVWGGTVTNEKTSFGSLKYPAGFKRDLVGYEWSKDGEQGFVADLKDAPEGALVFPSLKEEPLGMLRWVIEKWTSPEELEAMNRFRTRYLPGEMTSVLRDFPREGVYDCWMILENGDGGFRHIDERVLDAVKWKFHYDKKSYEEKLEDEKKIEQAEMESRRKEEEELDRAFRNFDLKLDKEEKERRAEYWAKKHEYALDSTGTFL